MQTLVSPSPKCHRRPASRPKVAIPCTAFTETELAHRWRLSVKTLRRWRQDHRGPIYCKFGTRITYLIADVEAFEQRVARYSTDTLVFPSGGTA